MKVLHVITRLILGGAQKNTVMSCAAQVQSGHEVHLAFGPIYGPEGSLLQDARDCGAVTHLVPSMRRAVLPPHDLSCYFALRRLIARIQPDVVHTHSSKAGIIGRGAAWAQRVPAVVHTIHGLPFHDRQSRVIHHAYVIAEKWAAKRCHRLIGITQAMCDAFVAKGIATAERCCVIPSGIDLSAFEVGTPPRDVTRKAYGGAYVAMNSASLGATRVFAWPNAEVAVMGSVAAVRILHRRRLAELSDEQQRAEMELELAAEHEVISGGVTRAVELGFVDEIVDPTETRRKVAKVILDTPGVRGLHGNIPL